MFIVCSCIFSNYYILEITLRNKVFSISISGFVWDIIIGAVIATVKELVALFENSKDALLSRIKHEYLCCDKNLVVNGCF